MATRQLNDRQRAFIAAYIASTDYIEAPTFERVATAAVECYRSGAC